MNQGDQGQEDARVQWGIDDAQIFHRKRQDMLLWDEVRLTSEKKSRKRLRVGHDVKLFETLQQQNVVDEFLEIAQAFTMITAGMGAKIFDPSRIAGGPGNIQAGANLMQAYWQWAPEVTRRKLDHSMAMDTIAFGYSLRETDRRRRNRKGTAQQNLLQCLELFAQMQGRRYRRR